MDKLTAIKIKHPNGQYSDPILLSVKAENVQYDDTRGLKDKIQEMESRVNDILTPTPGSTSFDQEIEDARKGTDIDPATGERIDYGSLYSSITTQYAKSLNTVLIRETPPTEKENKLWIDKSTSGNDEVQVLTIDDLDIIAPIYSENSTYAVGDYVVYDGSLYRCNTNIETAETWDSTHWAGVNVSEKLVDIDKTLTIADMAADAKVTGDELTDLKNALDGLRSYPVLIWETKKSVNGNTGAIQNNNYNALTKPINVNKGDVIIRKTPAKDSNNITLLFYINTYNQNTWLNRYQLSYGEIFTIPDGVTHVRLIHGRGSSSGVISSVEDINLYFSADWFSYNTVVKQYNTFIGTSFEENKKIGVYNLGNSVYSSMSDAPTASSEYGGGSFVVIPTGSNTNSIAQLIYDVVYRKIYRRYLTYNTSSEQYDISNWLSFDFNASYMKMMKLDNNASVLSSNTDLGVYRVGSWAQEPMKTYINNGDFPDLTYQGGYMFVVPGGGTNGIVQIVYDIIRGNTFKRFISGSSLQNVGEWNAENDIKWCAIGDSITYGVYSTGASSTAVNQNNCYAKRVAIAIHAQPFYNSGIRGLGFVHHGNNDETLKTNIIDAINWTNYNLVTVALGINDYYGTSNIGDTTSNAWDETVYGNIRGTIESLITANPNMKIIFITPFNMSKYGDASTHWGRNYTRNRIGTLNDVKNAIIYWCDYYGIEYINETDYSIINDLNIQSMLPDGLHPTQTAHKLIAKEIAKKINFS